MLFRSVVKAACRGRGGQMGSGCVETETLDRVDGDEVYKQLEAEAAWGRRFAEDLRADVTRLGALCGLPAGALVTMAAHMDAETLLSVREALQDTVSKRFPQRPQLPGVKAAGKRQSGSPEYRI